MEFPSKKEFNENTQFALLPSDDYELIIVELKEEKQDKYMAKPDKETGEKPQEDVLKVKLEVVGFKDGAKATDEAGEDATGKNVFFTGRPASMGWQQDGTPSKTRCILAYATGQGIDDKLNIEDWQDLVGKTVFAEIIQKANQKGKKTNRISRFITPRKIREESKSKKDDEVITEVANGKDTSKSENEIKPEDIPY